MWVEFSVVPVVLLGWEPGTVKIISALNADCIQYQIMLKHNNAVSHAAYLYLLLVFG